MPSDAELVKSMKSCMYCVVTVSDNSCYITPWQHQMVKEQAVSHDKIPKMCIKRDYEKNLK